MHKLEFGEERKAAEDAEQNLNRKPLNEANMTY
jgi:hypothetical protein